MNMKKLMNELVADEEQNCRTSVRQRIWYYTKQYLLFLIMTVIFQLVYIEIGHDKGWPYAERWYTYINNIGNKI